MKQDRIVRALARIEAAAKRIETAAARPPAPAPEPVRRDTSNLADEADIAARHERLRQEAWAALAEIDSLIETLDA